MKDLPPTRIKPNQNLSPVKQQTGGILLGTNCYWNPLGTNNPHGCVIGTSGAGKTQTLKAIAHEMCQVFPQTQVVVIDYHGDLETPGEQHIALNQLSPHGINPLVLDLDPKGGGPNLQAIAVAGTLKRSLQLGPNQEGLTIKTLQQCYSLKGIVQAQRQSWTNSPPTFGDLQRQLQYNADSGCKESNKLLLKLAASFQYGIFSKPQPKPAAQLIRYDLTALLKAPGLAAIATESILKQLMDTHRLAGETQQMRTYLFIDEAKEVKDSPSVKTVVRDARKYGLGLLVASQMPKDFSDDLLANTALKIVLPVDAIDCSSTAKKFKLGESAISSLQPLEAIVRMGNLVNKVQIKPYWQRIQ